MNQWDAQTGYFEITLLRILVAYNKCNVINNTTVFPYTYTRVNCYYNTLYIPTFDVCLGTGDNG